MIARAESGQARGNMDDFDAADVAKGIQELYEPLAEDGGMTLRVKTAPAPVHGNRELISQALANLVENAIKYGKPTPPCSRSARRGERRQGNPDRGAARRRLPCCSASPTMGRGSRKPTASTRWSDLSGWRPAAPSPVPALA